MRSLCKLNAIVSLGRNFNKVNPKMEIAATPWRNLNGSMRNNTYADRDSSWTISYGECIWWFFFVQFVLMGTYLVAIDHPLIPGIVKLSWFAYNIIHPRVLEAQRRIPGSDYLKDLFSSSMFCHLAGLILGVAIEIPYTVLANTGNHRSLKDLASRYLSTSDKITKWYSSDIFDPTTEGELERLSIRAGVKAPNFSNAYTETEWDRKLIMKSFKPGAKSIATVRKMHAASHRTMNRSHPKPMVNELWMSQFYMATTQISFVGLMMICPKAVGLGHLTKVDKEAIIHYWRCIGKW